MNSNDYTTLFLYSKYSRACKTSSILLKSIPELADAIFICVDKKEVRDHITNSEQYSKISSFPCLIRIFNDTLNVEVFEGEKVYELFDSYQRGNTKKKSLVMKPLKNNEDLRQSYSTEVEEPPRGTHSGFTNLPSTGPPSSGPHSITEIGTTNPSFGTKLTEGTSFTDSSTPLTYEMGPTLASHLTSSALSGGTMTSLGVGDNRSESYAKMQDNTIREAPSSSMNKKVDMKAAEIMQRERNESDSVLYPRSISKMG